MKRYPYFEDGKGIAFCTAGTPEQIKIIANRFIGDNPPLAYTARLVSETGINSRDIDLSERLGHGADGYSVVCGYIQSEAAKVVYLDVRCYAPVKIYANGKEIFSSAFYDESACPPEHRLEYAVECGITVFTLLCRRTAAGFGCSLTTPTTALAPFSGRRGMAGWVWSGLLAEPDASQLERITLAAANCGAEEDTGLSWYPEIRRPDDVAPPYSRFFGDKEGYRLSWTKISPLRGKSASLEISGECEVYIDGEPKLSCANGRGELELSLRESASLIVKSRCAAPAPTVAVRGCTIEKPYPVHGLSDPWLYAAVPDNDCKIDPAAHKLISRYLWRSADGLCVRRFYEGSFSSKDWVASGGTAFGRWDYPVGVTLQGLLRAGKALGIEEICAYVQSHMALCVDSRAEAVRDRDLYGGAAFLGSLLARRTLDDFGAMGAAMLECSRDSDNPAFRQIADELWEVVRTQIAYMPNGAYYRKESDTLWADDLYMGTSFLGRYYERFGVREALDLAAGQFLAFNELLFLPEHQVFSHVYDVKRGLATGVAWGRGNGWVLYSLAELLERTPENHALKSGLLELFRTLCGGYLKLQDERGYWHQVLTDRGSYEETSCTAMFVYAFSKGVRLGWFDDPCPYETSARKGWNAISSYSVDKKGNVHAVCKGSGFSFTKEYYSEDLYWVTNDNHGVGIVLLAACELMKL